MSQSFDDNNNIKRWVPQASTNRFPVPRIIDYTLQGYVGDNFYINIHSHGLDPNLLKIAFDSCITICQFTIQQQQPDYFTLHTIVPNYDLNTRVPIYLILQSPQFMILDSWFIGYFIYYTAPPPPPPQITTARKRTSSNEEESDIIEEQKRPRSITSADYYPYVGLPPTQPSPRREFFTEETYNTVNTSTTTNPNYDILQSQLPIQPTFDPLNTNTSTTTTTSTSTTTITTNNPPPISPSSTMSQHTPLLSMPNTSPLSLPLSVPSSSNTVTSAPDPFANLLNKANLIIQGDLMEMTNNWNSEEWENKRRIVQFHRRQEGNEVTCKFNPYHLSSTTKADFTKLIVVSCIYYKEKNDYFITSVDCIYLLEHLIGVKFTVEEKNRIRRNLEGYKPLTVSKLKPESGDFFKIIMGFPNPKPRNIEKDVKVFPWSILAEALKKIISKYTASYSSTASVNYDIISSSSPT